jgi:hypothetical protein
VNFEDPDHPMYISESETWFGQVLVRVQPPIAIVRFNGRRPYGDRARLD